MLTTLPSADPVVIIALTRGDKNPLWLGSCYTNEVMRKHSVCQRSNLAAQTSRFHLYVNAPYVNKLCSTRGADSRWAYADHLDLVHLTTYQLLKSDNRQMIGNSTTSIHLLEAGRGASGPWSDWMRVDQGRANAFSPQWNWSSVFFFSHISPLLLLHWCCIHSE